MKPVIYLDELGYRNALTESEQIIWYWEQKSKMYKSKGGITKYYNSLLSRYDGYLTKIQAYELIAFLKSKVTDEQRENSAKRKLQMQAKAQLELAKFEEWHSNYALKRKLTTIQSLN